MTLFKNLKALVLCLIFYGSASYAQPQLRQLSFPGEMILFDSTGTATKLSLPLSTTQAFPNGYDDPTLENYKWVHNMMYDKDTNLLFYLIDEHIFDSQGNRIDELLAPSGVGAVTGYNEAVIIPVPGVCNKFYIITAKTLNPDADNQNALDPIPYYATIDCNQTNNNGTNGVLLDSSGFTALKLPNYATFGSHASTLQFASTKINRRGWRWLFVQDGQYVYVYKVTSSGIAYSSKNTIQYGGGDSFSRSELEVIDRGNGYKLAFVNEINSGPLGLVGQAVYIQNADSNGIFTGNPTILAFNDPATNVIPTGLEFSPNGKYLYYTHWNSSKYPNCLRYWDSTSTTSPDFTHDSIAGVSNAVSQNFKYSQIELGLDSNLYYPTALGGNRTAILSNPDSVAIHSFTNSPTGLTFNQMKLTRDSTMFGKRHLFLAPDQIDGEVYYAKAKVVPLIPDSANGGTYACGDTMVYGLEKVTPGVIYEWGVFNGTITYNGNDTIKVAWQTDSTNYALGGYITCIPKVNCPEMDTLFINSCCKKDSVIYLNKKIIENDSTFFAGEYMVNDTLNLNGSLTLSGSIFWMAPEATIMVNDSNKFSALNATTIKAGCQRMWNTINVDTTATAKISRSNVLDAKYVISSTGGGIFQIERSTLTNNYVGVLVQNYEPLNSSYMNRSTVKGGTLLSNTFGATKSKTGIQTRNIGGLTIGTLNTFEALEYGIWNQNSNLKSHRNTFKNLVGTKCIQPCTPTSVGIYSVNDTTIVRRLEAGVSGDTTTYRNTFSNCIYGVYGSKHQNVFISGNLFNTLTTQGGLNGVTLKNITGYNGVYNDTIVVRDNRMVNQFAGINISEVKCNIIQVFSNTLSVDPSLLGTGVPMGIYVGNTTKNTSDLLINANRLTKYRYGIKVNAFEYPRIEADTVLLVHDASYGTLGVGINVVSCNEGNVESNFVNSTGANWWITGIHVESTPSLIVKCNTLEDIGRCITVGGSSLGTKITRNKFKDSEKGFMIGNGAIGDQVATGVSGSNSWEGTFTHHLFSYESDGTLSKWWMEGAPTSTTGNQSKNPSPLLNDSSGVNASRRAIKVYLPLAPDYDDFPSSTYSCGNGFNRMAGEENIVARLDKATALAIANNTADYPSLAEQNKWLHQHQLYNVILRDSALFADADLHSFIDSMSTSNSALIMEIDSTIAVTSDSVEANNSISELTVLVPVNTIEQNYKTVSEIYLRYIVGGEPMDAATLDMLRDIAVKCPYEDGPAVYQARAILMPFDDFIVQYSNTCENPETQSTNANRVSQQENPGESESNLEKDKLINVYPNPAENFLLVELGEGYDADVNMVIYNALGAKVQEISLNRNARTRIDIAELNNGLYHYTIFSTDTILKTSNLVIVK